MWEYRTEAKLLKTMEGVTTVTRNIMELLTLTLISFYDLLSYDSARVVHRRRGVELHSLGHIILNNVDT